MFKQQALSGVVDYEKLSGQMQGKIFDSLMEKVKVKADSKIIDIGCGTGNNTFKLSKMIGDEGIVTGIDPIKQRIEKASDVYGFKSNLNFKEGSAEDSWQFGTDHDLAVSTTVLHWVPVNKRKEAFRGIYKSLKPNSMFVFDAVRSHNFNSAFVVENVSCYNQFLENAFPLSKEDAENVLVEAEFQDISVTEVDICIPFPNLDVYLRWLACSMNVGGYTQILDDLRDICQSKDLTSLYDDNRQILHKHEYIFGYCRK